MHQTSSSINLNGKHLLFSSLQSPPVVTLDQFGNISKYEGYCFEIINTLKHFFNFTYTVSEPYDRSYGTFLRNNSSWSGMIGMILRKESDMGIGGFSFTFNRYEVVDFSVPFLEESTTILIPYPTQQRHLFACFQPFQLKVWIALLCVLAILPLLLWTSLRLSCKFNPKPTISPPYLSEAYLFVYGVLMAQSGLAWRFTINSSATILSSVWCLIVIVFIYGYIGTLVSFLSLPSFKPIISSMEELPSSEFTWVVPKSSALESLFMEAKEGIYKIIGDGLRHNPQNLIIDPERFAAQYVLNGSSVHINEKSFNELMIERIYKQTGQCSMSLAKTEFNKVYQGFIFPKDSPLKSIFDQKILQMSQSGLINHWQKKWWPSIHQCDYNEKQYTLRTLKLQDMLSLFLIWIIGLTLAVTCFIFENFVNLLHHYTKNK